MNKYIALFFSVSLFLFACGGDKASSNIIAPKEMAALLTDIHIVDGRMYALLQNPDTLYKYGTGKYLALFKKHHTDSVQFNRSFKYYSTQPVQLLAIYDQVLITLKKKVDSLNQVNNIHNKMADSINTINSARINDSLRKIQKLNPPNPRPLTLKQLKHVAP